MRFHNYAFLIIASTTLASCKLVCIEKKTGLHKSSPSIKFSKENALFKTQFDCNKSFAKIDSVTTLQIENAWVENSWSYECVNGEAEIIKENRFQFVIAANYQDSINHTIDHFLYLENTEGCGLGAILSYKYHGQDTLTFTIKNEHKKVIDSLKFWKRRI